LHNEKKTKALTVSSTEHEDVSVMTIVVCGDDKVIEQVKKQLNKLIDVIKVIDHTDIPSIQRELVILKVNATPAKRAEIYQLGDMFRAEVTDISPKSLTFALKGDPQKVENFIELLRPYGIKEMMKTGRISLLKES